ncbi:Extra-cytoplasmic solute receptor family protein 77 [Cupriavidus necator]|uniref:Extra-cytoplasmic solute receptor family protein 77 n=1 Tax=Cupriavidus necator TaxID=106590 RepID=A0A1K0ILP8_CUPNE|nr:Extra-cytoplasmic solute receptor family protein 77 [Cupriavidus necator]
MSENPQRRKLLLAAAAVACLPLASLAADAWPSRPIRIIVPYPAGGGPDISVRKLAEVLGKQLGVSVIVENKPGASALLGSQVAAASRPDGYTVAYITSGLVTVQAMTHKIDMTKALQPVARINASAFVAVVPSTSKYRTLSTLLAEAKAQPGKLSYGSAGVGSPAHMAVEHLRMRVPGLNFLHVPYKGAVESINALRAGEIDFSVLVLSTAMPLIKAGTLKALAVTTPDRVSQLPEVPTFAEVGVAQYGFKSWGGFALPAGTPPAITDKLFAALRTASRDPGFQSLQESLGAFQEFSASPSAFSKELDEAIRTEELLVKKIQ